MSEQDGTKNSTKQRRSRKTNTTNHEHGKQAPPVQRPTNDDKEAWKEHWKAQEQPWRTEPEIDEERQKYLAERRSIMPDIKQGIYPFKGIKLNRADVEWVLAAHENGRGPVYWSDPSQREREGLDLRGANLKGIDLRGEFLSGFPLSKMRAGLTLNEWNEATVEQREASIVHLEGAKLEEAYMERVRLKGAHLEGANLQRTHLEGASIEWAHLEGANLQRAHLEGTDFFETHLEGKQLQPAELEHLRQWIPDFPEVLPPADLRSAFFSAESTLRNATLYSEHQGFVSVADVRWDGVNLAAMKWPKGKWSRWLVLADEYEAQRAKTTEGTTKGEARRLTEYEVAVRANRQLAVALQDQGLSEQAAYFAYRAQKLQRVVLGRQRKFGQYLFSLFLDLLAGYGYKPMRSVIAYLVIILGFMCLYLLNAHLVTPHLRWDEALVLSVSSFHGRGFFPQDVTLGDTYARLAAAEAIVGLIIEISFIATFTQRFLGK